MLKNIFAVILSLTLVLPSFAQDIKNENEKDILERQIQSTERSLSEALKAIKTPLQHNPEINRLEKKTKFSIFLKRLKDIEYIYGEQIRISLECRIEFNSDDSMKRIEFLETRVKETNSLKQTRKLINESPVSDKFDHIFVEFQDFNENGYRKKNFEKYTLRDITERRQYFTLINTYLNWINQVKFKLYVAERSILNKYKRDATKAFDI